MIYSSFFKIDGLYFDFFFFVNIDSIKVVVKQWDNILVYVCYIVEENIGSGEFV